MNRPQGVTILGWIAVVFGVIGALGSVIAIIGSIGLTVFGAASLGLAGVPAAATAAGYGVLAIVVSVWLLIMSVVQIAFGAGTLGLKPWAWTLGVWWCYISAISNVITLVSRSLFNGLIGIVVAIALLYYLFRDDVRAAFGKLDTMPPSFLVPVFETMDGWFNNGAASQGGHVPPASPQAPQGYAPPAPPVAPPPTYAPPAPPVAPPPTYAPPAPPADPGAPGEEPPA